MAATFEVTLDQNGWAALRGRDGLASLPGFVYVIVFMEVVDKRSPFANENFKVAVAAAAEIALDNGSRAGSMARNDLAAFPGIVDIIVFVEVMDEVGPFQRDDLEIAMTAGTEIALDDVRGSGDSGGDDLAALPTQRNVAIVVKVVDEITAFRHDHFKVSMGAAAKVALDHAARAGRRLGNHLSPNPGVVGVAVVMPVVDEVVAL